MNVNCSHLFRFLCGLVTGLVATAATAGEVATNYAGFGLSLQAQRHYALGAPIKLSMTMTNGTLDRAFWDLPLDGCSCLFGYLQVIALPARTNVPCPSLPNKDNTGKPGYHYLWQEPGEVSGISFDLNRVFRIKTPGDYEIRLLARMPKPIPLDNQEPTVPLPPLLITITNVPALTNGVADGKAK